MAINEHQLAESSIDAALVYALVLMLCPRFSSV